MIVLSCHDEFEYVKEAMKEGADEYVLKNTLNEESLYTLLQAAKEKLASRKMREADVLQEKRKLCTAMQRIPLTSIVNSCFLTGF